jgi:hypothetical protein
VKYISTNLLIFKCLAWPALSFFDIVAIQRANLAREKFMT